MATDVAGPSCAGGAVPHWVGPTLRSAWLTPRHRQATVGAQPAYPDSRIERTIAAGDQSSLTTDFGAENRYT